MCPEQYSASAGSDKVFNDVSSQKGHSSRHTKTAAIMQQCAKIVCLQEEGHRDVISVTKCAARRGACIGKLSTQSATHFDHQTLALVVQLIGVLNDSSEKCGQIAVERQWIMGV